MVGTERIHHHDALVRISPGRGVGITMHGPDGTDYPNRIEWLEIVPPERITLLHAGYEDDPEAFTSTVTLVEQGVKTVVTLRSVFKTKSQRDKVVGEYRAIEGAEQTLGRLAGYVDSRTEETEGG